MREEVVRAIALSLKWSASAVRGLLGDLEQQGVHVIYRPMSGELCPACTEHWATDEGLCMQCLTERDLLEQRHAIEDEEARLEKRVRNARDALKQERKRMRERFGANPRKKFDWAVVAAYAIDHPEEWEEACADIEALLLQGTLTE